MSECEIVGCPHNSIREEIGLCKEHEIDLSYFRANVFDNTGKFPSLATYIYEKNKELLG